MAALPAVTKVVRVDHHFSDGGNPNVQVRNFFQYSGSLSTADAATWLTNIVTALGVFMASFSQPTLVLTLSQLTDLTSTSAAQVVNTTGFTGGASASQLPAGVCLVIKKKIARRYRGGHPRVYLPGMAETYLSTPILWNATSLANIVAAWNTFINACTAATNPAAIGTITEVNVSYFQHYTNVTFPSGRAHPVPTQRPTPLVDPVISHAGNAIPASQRRRNKQSA